MASVGADSVGALVPAGVTTGTVSVTTPAGTAVSSQIFTVAVPTIKRFTAAAVGQPVTISGANLSGATLVTFGGAAATVLSDSADSVIAVVPAAATTGPVTVRTPGGVASSARSFTPRPVITSFDPQAGSAGATVTLNGTGLSGAKRVSLAGRRVRVLADSATQIVISVPRRASSGLMEVQTPGGVAFSTNPFTVA